MPTLADALTNATAAVNANAQAYFDLQQSVALREGTAVQAAGYVPDPTDATELARGMGRGVYLGGLGGAPNALAGTIGAGVVAGAYLKTLPAWTRLRGVPMQANTSATVTVTITGIGSATGTVSGPLKRRDGSALQAGDLTALVPVEFQSDGNGNFLLVGLGAVEVPRVVSNPILYVRPDGNDLNDGSASDTGHAFATILSAITAGAKRFNLAAAVLTIQLVLSAANPAATFAMPGSLPSGIGPVLIQGDTANQVAYQLQGVGPAGSGSACFGAYSIVALKGLTLLNSGTTNHTLGANSGSVITVQNVTFGMPQGNPNSHMVASNGGAVQINAGCVIQWGCGSAMFALGGTITVNGVSINLINTPVFTSATVVAQSCGTVQFAAGSSFTGTGASGPRFLATLNGVINTFGGGANFIPGSTAGSTSTGGQYA